MEAQSCDIAVVMVPLPMQGHLNQLLHLSHLITSYGIPVHFTGFATHNRQAKVRIHGWETESLAKIHFHDYPLPPLAPHDTSPPSNSGHSVPFPMQFYPLFEAATQLREPVAQLLQQLSTMFRRVVVIHDIVISSVVQDVKSILNAESYSLMPISAFTLFLNSLDKKAEITLQLEPTDIPKCIPSNEGCTPPDIANFVANQLKFVGNESGRIYNTSRVIEDKYVGLLEKLSTAEMKHFVLGPFHPVKMESKSESHRHECFKWLDQQRRDSVIYVCFGSSTSLSYEQISELANGLERSGQKFIWVLKDSDKADIFEKGEVRRPQLPQGFEERVRNRGIVVRDWAPQLEILAHPSTGGFLSHCGWNSCFESISMGVPIVAWPMHSDQPRNTLLVTDVLKIGTLVRDWEHRNQLVKAKIIENAVKTLMDSEEGKEMRKRAQELGNAVRNSVAKGGVASKELDSFIAHITK